jgi:hypothetical protein
MHDAEVDEDATRHERDDRTVENTPVFQPVEEAQETEQHSADEDPCDCYFGYRSRNRGYCVRYHARGVNDDGIAYGIVDEDQTHHGDGCEVQTESAELSTRYRVFVVDVG